MPLSSSTPRRERIPLVVFSHLRWGFVFQRPQHLLTRLALDFDVYFIEEPVFHHDAPRFQRARQAGGVEVLTPFTNVRAGGFNDEQMPLLNALVTAFAAEQGIVEPLVWLYTPMALPLVADLEPRAVVYDCMDDLASFKFAPAQLVERERALMELADVVLTGGPSLYEARKHRHPNIHCLPSAVDAAHFSPANLDGDALEATVAAQMHRGMAHPRLGFVGVIDERLDIALVAALADARPDWQIVMAGPVVKIDAAALPRRPNLHWVGMQRYEVLPHLLAQWDACLLPFALNEATRFISPTKTLEYLAGGKLVANRLLPEALAGRNEWEQRVFWGAWVVALLHAAWRSAPIRLGKASPAWHEQCIAVAVLAVAAVVLNAVTTGDHLLKTLGQPDWPVAGVDLALLFVAFCAASVAVKQRRRRRTPRLELRHA